MEHRCQMQNLQYLESFTLESSFCHFLTVSPGFPNIRSIDTLPGKSILAISRALHSLKMKTTSTNNCLIHFICHIMKQIKSVSKKSLRLRYTMKYKFCFLTVNNCLLKQLSKERKYLTRISFLRYFK